MGKQQRSQCLVYLEGPSSWVMHGDAEADDLPGGAALPVLLRKGWRVRRLVRSGSAGKDRPVGAAYVWLERVEKFKDS